MRADTAPRGRLLLGPGHLGNPNDLSLRVVSALRSAALLVVEEGSDQALAATARTLSVTLPATAALPCSGALPPEVAERVYATLDDGGDVLLFGVEEGIPGYADPGAALVLAVRRQRPEVAIHSLGGTSVIGAALLASGLSVDRVTVLGVTTAPEPQRGRKLREVERWVGHLAGTGHAVGVLASGADVLELAHRLAGIGWIDARMVVCASLTLPGERVIDGAPEVVLGAGLEADAPTVVWVLAELRGWHPRAWITFAGRAFG